MTFSESQRVREEMCNQRRRDDNDGQDNQKRLVMPRIKWRKDGRIVKSNFVVDFKLTLLLLLLLLLSFLKMLHVDPDL